MNLHQRNGADCADPGGGTGHFYLHLVIVLLTLSISNQWKTASAFLGGRNSMSQKVSKTPGGVMVIRRLILESDSVSTGKLI